jgi:hypothetical protein
MRLWLCLCGHVTSRTSATSLGEMLPAGNVPSPAPRSVILALYLVATLTATQLVPQNSLMTRHAAWHAKDGHTYCDTIALMRRSLWSEAIYGGSRRRDNTLKITRALFERCWKPLRRRAN